MRAVTFDSGEVVVRDLPEPVPGRGELLVRVRSAGLNGADLLQRAGLYPPPPGAPAEVPGLELAGVVEDVGAGVTRFRAGSRVMALVPGGAQGELAVVPEGLAFEVPDGLDLAVAGGFPETFITAFDALVAQCGLAAGDRLLVTGASGGVGVAAAQLGVAAGAVVTASSRHERHHEALAALGAHPVLPTEAASRGPFDVILELVGGASVATDLELLAVGGRIAVIGIGAGARVELDLRTLMGRRARVLGSTLRARPLEERVLLVCRAEHHLVPLLERGALRVLVEAAFALEDARAAYDRFAAGGKLGKILLVTDGPGADAPA